MASYSGPNVINRGIVLNLDAASINTTKGRRNILDWSGWVVGSGAVTNYPANGDGNSRVLDANPWSTQDVVWDVSNQDAVADADGGWVTSSFAIDSTKMYRFSTWVRRKVIGNGSVYLGLYSNSNVLNRSDLVANSNPYFYSIAWSSTGIVASEWVLVVGHVWPTLSGIGTVHADSGVYNTAGTKIGACIDFVWDMASTTAQHRSYMFNSTDITTNQQWYQPRVDVINGYQPTITELLNDVGNKLPTYLPSIIGSMIGTTNFNSSSGGYLAFNGATAYVDCGNPTEITNIGGTNHITVGVWARLSAYGGSSAYSVLTVKGTSARTWLIENPLNTFRFTITAGGADTQIADVATHSLNTWYYIVGTYDGVTMKIYINGVLKNSKAQTGTLGSNAVSIKVGCNTPTTYNMTGDIAAVHVHSVTLNATEIMSMFNARRSRFNI